VGTGEVGGGRATGEKGLRGMLGYYFVLSTGLSKHGGVGGGGGAVPLGRSSIGGFGEKRSQQRLRNSEQVHLGGWGTVVEKNGGGGEVVVHLKKSNQESASSLKKNKKEAKTNKCFLAHMNITQGQKHEEKKPIHAWAM